MSALASADRERLARLLGMLGSDFDGELANAGRLADKLVGASALASPDVAAPTLPLNRWERELLRDLRRFSQLSPKQQVILIRIVVRLRAAGGAL